MTNTRDFWMNLTPYNFARRRLLFAQKMVELDDIPEECWWCCFATVDGTGSNHHCILKNLTRNIMPLCDVTDFIKYLLEYL